MHPRPGRSPHRSGRTPRGAARRLLLRERSGPGPPPLQRHWLRLASPPASAFAEVGPLRRGVDSRGWQQQDVQGRKPCRNNRPWDAAAPIDECRRAWVPHPDTRRQPSHGDNPHAPSMLRPPRESMPQPTRPCTPQPTHAPMGLFQTSMAAHRAVSSAATRPPSTSVLSGRSSSVPRRTGTSATSSLVPARGRPGNWLSGTCSSATT